MAKKVFFSISFISSVYLLSAQVQGIVPAQPIKSWTWNNYQVAFQAPTDLVVRENSDKVFYAGNDNVFITIYPWKGNDSVTRSNLPQLVQKWATDHKLSYSPMNAAFVKSSTSYLAYYLGGTGYHGMSTYVAAIVVSIHPKDTYLVWLQYKAGYAASAMNILNSLSPQ